MTAKEITEQVQQLLEKELGPNDCAVFHVEKDNDNHGCFDRKPSQVIYLLGLVVGCTYDALPTKWRVIFKDVLSKIILNDFDLSQPLTTKQIPKE